MEPLIVLTDSGDRLDTSAWLHAPGLCAPARHHCSHWWVSCYRVACHF